MMPRFLIATLLFLLATGLNAQTDSTSNLVTDRPTQAATAYLLSKGTWQIETGYLFSEVREGVPGNELKLRSIAINNTLIRYGLTDKIELNLTQNLTKGEVLLNGVKQPGGFTELLPTSLAARIHLAEEKGALPQLALLAGVTGSPFSQFTTGTTFDFRVNAEHALSDKLALGYNLGGIVDEDFGNFNGLYTLVFTYALTPKFAAFAELYGTFDPGDTGLHSLDYGFTYLINSNFQLDIFGGNGLSDFTPDVIFGGGLSLRIPRK